MHGPTIGQRIVVKQYRAKKSIGRRLIELGLAGATLVTACRIGQLTVGEAVWRGEGALANKQLGITRLGDRATLSQRDTLTRLADRATLSQRERGIGSKHAASAKDISAAPTPAAADAELTRLYAACPMARVIDLKTVATSPERVDALVPPFRQTALREPITPVEPAIPRIRYPVSVHAGGAGTGGSGHDAAIRIAQRTAAAGSESAKSSDWLIDPKEWLAPDATAVAKPPTASPAASAAPAASPPAEKPAAAQPKPVEVAKPPVTTAPAETKATPPAPQTPATIALPKPAPPTPAPPTPAPPKPALPPMPSTQITPASPPVALPAPAKPIFSTPANAAELPLPPAGAADANATSGAKPPAVDPHLELFARNAYPSARDCATCHEEIYNDWSVSAHAYAAVSPMFQKFEQRLNDLSSGTLGYFCMRCHAPVATAMCVSRAEPLWKLSEVARDGITCIACHRVQYVYGKSNGERRIETGPIFAPVLGGIEGSGVAEVVHRKDQFKVKTAPGEPGPGQNIHLSGVYFDPLTRSEFCTPCHQVAVDPGIKLEVVWEQYRASPACKKGIQCQDCHMGRVPGLPLGYDCGPIAKIDGKTVNDHRKKSNHIFYGPNYPIAHPGVFPFNLKANRWTMDQWLTFDWRAGWGTKEFEKAVASGQLHVAFPPVWAEADDRFDAREIIDANFKKMSQKRDLRVAIMESGSHVDGPFFDSALCRGQDLNFHYVVTNTNEGHNLLTASLGAQPQLWANIVLIGPDGNRLWETGYLDSLGDVANIHSEDVRQHRLPYDFQLFNLQSMFLIQGATGTDREFYVPVNLDIDQLPFIRPGVQPITNINHPPGIRMESHSLAPLGSRDAVYHVPGKYLQQPGTYRLTFRMRSRSEPLYFMRFCGATEEMLRAEDEWMIDVHPMTVEFTVH